MDYRFSQWGMTGRSVLFEEAGVGFVPGFGYGSFYFVDKFTGVFEVAVYAGEADVSDLVELLEVFHNGFADVRGGDFTVKVLEDVLLDAVGDFLDTFGRDGALVAGFLEACDYLGAVVGNAGVVFFDDGKLKYLADLFISGKAALAFEALATAANGAAIVAGTAVHDMVVIIFAPGASQRVSPSLLNYTI